LIMARDLELSLLKTFIAIVETGRLTQAGRRVSRTQPAISHQLRRLENSIGRPLFKPDRRRLVLTPDGEVLLQYARMMTQLNDEAKMRFSSPEVGGRVVLGTPDLYAAYLLPELLGTFAKVHPRVEIELLCRRSIHLQEAMAHGEIDLAILTRQHDMPMEHVVRQEPLVWVVGPESGLEFEPSLPLALYPEGSVYREAALEALTAVRRRWRVASVSDSVAGLQAAIFAGLAIAVLPLCAVVPGMRVLDRRNGLPPLPAIDLVLLRRPTDLPSAAGRLADYILRKLGDASAFRPRTGAPVAA
jgi:DNA-binding transcriptional LysR family regulator